MSVVYAWYTTLSHSLALITPTLITAWHAGPLAHSTHAACVPACARRRYVFFTFDTVYVKHMCDTLKMTNWGRVFYTNFLALPPLMVALPMLNEQAVLYKLTWGWSTLGPLVLSCVVGVAMSHASYLLRETVSATYFTIVGILCKVRCTAAGPPCARVHAFARHRSCMRLLSAGSASKPPAPAISALSWPCTHARTHAAALAGTRPLAAALHTRCRW